MSVGEQPADTTRKRSRHRWDDAGPDRDRCRYCGLERSKEITRYWRFSGREYYRDGRTLGVLTDVPPCTPAPSEPTGGNQ